MNVGDSVTFCRFGLTEHGTLKKVRDDGNLEVVVVVKGAARGMGWYDVLRIVRPEEIRREGR